MKQDDSTETRIRQVARDMFIEKGYAKTTSRDIAKRAGTNLALLNYYFRSKEQLFKQIMMESLHDFFELVIGILDNHETTLKQKLSLLSDKYIDALIRQPDLPMFILSELRTHPKEFLNSFLHNLKIKQTVIFRQLKDHVGKSKLQKIDPFHFMMNLMSMLLFPFIARPLLGHVMELDPKAFEKLMNERKQLIPIWIMQMFEEDNHEKNAKPPTRA